LGQLQASNRDVQSSWGPGCTIWANPVNFAFRYDHVRPDTYNCGARPLADNLYGWCAAAAAPPPALPSEGQARGGPRRAKEAYEHLGFLYAVGKETPRRLEVRATGPRGSVWRPPPIRTRIIDREVIPPRPAGAESCMRTTRPPVAPQVVQIRIGAPTEGGLDDLGEDLPHLPVGGVLTRMNRSTPAEAPAESWRGGGGANSGRAGAR
jgi:hypothetical protein